MCIYYKYIYTYITRTHTRIICTVCTYNRYTNIARLKTRKLILSNLDKLEKKEYDTYILYIYIKYIAVSFLSISGIYSLKDDCSNEKKILKTGSKVREKARK